MQNSAVNKNKISEFDELEIIRLNMQINTDLFKILILLRANVIIAHSGFAKGAKCK